MNCGRIEQRVAVNDVPLRKGSDRDDLTWVFAGQREF